MKKLALVATLLLAAVLVIGGQVLRGDADIVTPTQVQVPCSSGDSTPAWNAAIAQALGGTDKVVHLFACTYHFSSPPAPITGGIEVIGQGLYSTFLERDYSPGPTCAAAACEFIQVADIGETIKDLAIFARTGTAGGWGLHVVSTDVRKTNFVSLDNVYVSGYGTYAVSVFIDGLNSHSPLQGVRAVHLTNVSVFNGTVFGFECWNCVDMNWQGGGVWQGFGSTQHVVVGGPSSAVDMVAAFVNGRDVYWTGSQLQ